MDRKDILELMNEQADDDELKEILRELLTKRKSELRKVE